MEAMGRASPPASAFGARSAFLGLVAVLAVGFQRAQCAADLLPAPLGAVEIRSALDRYAPGALSLESWEIIERQLVLADTAMTERVQPELDRLLEVTGVQFWLNWPVLKHAPVRHWRERLHDEQVAIESALCAEAGARLGAPFDGALARLAMARRRQLRPPWPLLGVSPVDLERIAVASIDLEALEPATREAIDAQLLAWAQQFDGLLAMHTAIQRQLFDRFEQWLVASELDPAELPAPSKPWLAAAFDWWQAHDRELTTSGRTLLSLEAATVDRIAALLPEPATWRWRASCMSLGSNLAMWGHRDFIADEFALVLRLRGLDEAQRAQIEHLRSRWIEQDVQLCTLSLREYTALSPALCPLTWEHFGPDDRHAALRDHLGALDVARRTLATGAIARLRSLLGAAFDRAFAAAAPGAADETLLEPPPPSAFEPPTSREAPPRWVPRRVPSCIAAQAREAGWFDAGPLDGDCARSVAAWLGLSGNALEVWVAVERDLAARVDSLLPRNDAGAVLPTWRFDDGYRHDIAAAARWLDASRARFALLVDGERELWQLAEALTETAAHRRRVELVAAAREAVLLTAPLRLAFRAWRWDHVAERPISATAVDWLSAPSGAAPVAALPNAAGFAPASPDATGPVPTVPSSTPLEDALLEPSRRLLELARNRWAALLPLVEALAQLQDELMWSRGDRGDRLHARQTHLVQEFLARDAEHRAAIATVQGDVAEHLLTMGAIGRSIVEAWQAEGYPAVHSDDPAAVAILESDHRAASGDRDLAEGLAALLERLRRTDETIAAKARAECERAGLDAFLRTDSEASRHRRMATFRAMREEQAQRALVRRDLLRLEHVASGP